VPLKHVYVALSIIFFMISCTKAPEINVVPMPNSVSQTSGVFKVSGKSVGIDASVDAKSAAKIMDFASRLTLVTGKPSNVQEGEGDFYFVANSALADEEYTIDISKNKVNVQASSYNGFLYALTTLGQMLPPSFYGSKVAPKSSWVLPCATIKDKPRFAYRGMHKDDSRHFFGVEEAKRYLDVMAMYKLNRLHWHLTDDQGWRVEIKRYPRLTEVGSQRANTIVGHMVAEGQPYETDGTPYGGFFTQDEIREVVAYAEDLGITIVPEIDLPGHMLAALASYPELGCTGGPYEVWNAWGVAKEVLCVGKESTFDFIEGVLTEIMDLFPSEYIHIGGDECPKDAWKVCPRCQARIRALGLKDDDNASAEQYLQNYVTARVQKFLADHGRKIIGWDEILEGQLSEGATVMSWRGPEGGIKAAGDGFDSIMTPTGYCYFDYYQSDQTDKEPLSIGGYVPIDTVYSFDPYKGVPDDERHHIIGVQANLWTEYIATPEHLEYMLLPRMVALSEVQWCENRDYDRFLHSLTTHQFPILDIRGYTYSKAVIGIYGMR